MENEKQRIEKLNRYALMFFRTDRKIEFRLQRIFDFVTTLHTDVCSYTYTLDERTSKRNETILKTSVCVRDKVSKPKSALSIRWNFFQSEHKGNPQTKLRFDECLNFLLESMEIKKSIEYHVCVFVCVFFLLLLCIHTALGCTCSFLALICS